MATLKYYLYGFIALFLISAVVAANVLWNQNKKLKAEVARVQNNNLQLMADNRNITTLNIRQKEVTGRIKLQRDSIAELLKIKPKQITKIVTIENTVTDTVKVPVLTTIVQKGEYVIRDSTECLKLRYRAFLKDDTLTTVRELLEYDNSIHQTFYKKRPHKFLFIKYGKWQYLQNIGSKCGKNKIQTIEFMK